MNSGKKKNKKSCFLKQISLQEIVRPLKQRTADKGYMHVWVNGKLLVKGLLSISRGKYFLFPDLNIVSIQMYVPATTGKSWEGQVI